LRLAEIRYLIREEWARTAEDILWRRTKLGLQGGEELAKAVLDVLPSLLEAEGLA
jgi:glycerol-3-phosphate dehydrogenase